MKKLLLMLLVVGMLIGAGGCTFTMPELLIIDGTTIHSKNTKKNKKFIELYMKWPTLKFSEEKPMRKLESF